MQLTTEQWNAINVILSHYNVTVSCDDEVAIEVYGVLFPDTCKKVIEEHIENVKNIKDK